jgi:hypothetical protein
MFFPWMLLATCLPTSRRVGGLACGVWDVIGMRSCAGQYPGEKEIMFPPYKCLEAHGDAHLESDAHEVIVFPLNQGHNPFSCSVSRHGPSKCRHDSGPSS